MEEMTHPETYLLLPLIGLLACMGSATQPSIESDPFGETPEKTPIDVYTLRNSNGLELRAITYGGIVLSLKVPDTEGSMADVVLGYHTLSDYVESSPYFGAIVGRYGNRIANGSFELDGQTYALAVNNGPNHLHGGIVGFDKVVWDAEPLEMKGAVGLRLSYTSKDGEEGYPGTLQTVVTYLLTNEDEFVVEYEATTDKATHVNLTQHSYFNLAGEGSGDIMGHEVMINALHFTPVDSTLIPTGELRSVEGTPFDLRDPVAIGTRIDENNEQLNIGGGFDHNFVLAPSGDSLVLAARIFEPVTGRVMEVLTSEPGVQFYTGNFLGGSPLPGKAGKPYGRRTGFCLETQHFPDSPNNPHFPSTILRPGETYQTRTVYRFGAEKTR